MISHSFEHFKIEIVPHIICISKDRCIGKFKEIMGGNAKIYGLNVLRFHAVGDHPFIIGIYFKFVVIGGKRPVKKCRLKLFHLHIRPFDNTEFNGGTTISQAFSGPFCHLLLYGKTVRKVGLKNNTC